jgi:hypothetical protein
MFMLAIGCWRRDRRKLAVVLTALAQLTHAAVLVPIVAVVVLLQYRHEQNKRALITGWLITLVVALPAMWLVFASPVSSQNSILYTAWIELETVALRSLAFLVPMGLLAVQRAHWRRTAPALLAGGLVLAQLVTIPISGMATGWGAINRRPAHGVSALLSSSEFVPGATYRVLTFGDQKYGQYSIVRAGGHLDSEFFPESMSRRSFPSEADYARFLTKRQVDYVVIDPKYKKFKTNEQSLLDGMASSKTPCVDGVEVRSVDETPGYELYAITRNCTSS